MWICISLISMVLHTASICPPPAIAPLNLTGLMTPSQRSDKQTDLPLDLNSPRTPCTDPARGNSLQPIARPTSANPKKKINKHRILCPCSSSSSSDDDEQILPYPPLQEQEPSPAIKPMDHVPPTTKTGIPRPPRNITPPPSMTPDSNDAALVQRVDIRRPEQPTPLERIDMRRPGHNTPPLTSQALPTTDIPPLTLSQAIAIPSNPQKMMQTAFIWATQQFALCPSKRFTPFSPHNHLMYKLTTTTIPTTEIQQSVFSLTPNQTSHMHKVTIQSFSKTKTHELISLCISFIHQIQPEEITPTPLVPLLAYLHTHLPNTHVIDLPANPTILFHCKEEDSSIHCILRYAPQQK